MHALPRLKGSTLAEAAKAAKLGAAAADAQVRCRLVETYGWFKKERVQLK